MLHREAVQFTPLRTERPCTARPLFREEAMFGDGLLGESGQVCPHTFFFFFFFGVRFSRQVGPGFWLAERILLWCPVAHNGTSVGMAIVLCLPR